MGHGRFLGLDKSHSLHIIVAVMSRDSQIPPIRIDPATKHDAKVRAAEEDISISAFLRAALRLFNKRDPSTKKIIEEAKKK